MRDQFDKLTVAKSKIQLQLIEVEEEKLRVSKALLDVQIESNQLKQSNDDERYGMINKLLQAENDILELEMKATKKHEGANKLEETLVDVQKEKRALSQEFVTLKNNFLQVRGCCEERSVSGWRVK